MSFPFERLDRDRGPIKGNVFVVTPYGKREFTNDDGEIIAFDFDEQYQDHYVPVIESVGMTPIRADSLYSDETIIGNVWCGIQEADIIIIDLTGSNRNVMVEFAWAYILGKKLIPLTQCRADMPTDLPGLRYIHYSPLVKDQARAEGELAKQLKVLAAEAGGERLWFLSRPARPAPPPLAWSAWPASTWSSRPRRASSACSAPPTSSGAGSSVT